MDINHPNANKILNYKRTVCWARSTIYRPTGGSRQDLYIHADELDCRLHSIFVDCILYSNNYYVFISVSLIKLQLTLTLCLDFGYENDSVYNAKKSIYFPSGELFNVASRVKMYISADKTDWVEIC